jgi:hypothetical protein
MYDMKSMETEETIPSLLQSSYQSQELESETPKKNVLAAGEHSSWFQILLMCPNKMETETETEKHVSVSISDLRLGLKEHC